VSERRKPTPGDIVGAGQKLELALSHQRFTTAEIVRAYQGQGGFSARSIGSTLATGTTPTASSYLRALESLTANNLLSAVVDTAIAQLVQNPDVRINTTGVGWTKQVNARRIGRALTGAWHASGLHDLAWQVAVDAALNPLGAVRWWMENGRLRCDRVLPHTIVYNPAEGRRPRNLYLHYGAPRAELADRFPKERAFIEDRAPKYRGDLLFDNIDNPYQPDVDLVDVWEYWRLGCDGEPGEYCLISGETSLDGDDWEYDFFPVVDLRWSESYASFGGRSLGAQLLPYQTRVNRMMRVIDESQTKACVPRMIAPKGSEFQGVTNRPMETIWYNPAAGAPQIVPGVALPPEFYSSLETEIRRAFELAGVSTSQGTGTTRRGLNSGKAIREDSEVAATRLRAQGTRLDRWYERNARVCLALMCDAYRDKDTREKAPGTHLLNEIDWRSFDVREDELEIRCSVVSGLPGQPSARLEYVQELIKAGLVKQRHALRMLAIPDVDKYEDAETAAFDLAASQIEAALYDQRYLPPEPEPQEYVETLIELGTKELMNAVRLQAPPENLELLRRLIAAAKRIRDVAPKPIQAGPPGMPAPGAPMGGMPPAANPYQPPEAQANPALDASSYAGDFGP